MHKPTVEQSCHHLHLCIDSRISVWFIMFTEQPCDTVVCRDTLCAYNIRTHHDIGHVNVTKIFVHIIVLLFGLRYSQTNRVTQLSSSPPLY